MMDQITRNMKTKGVSEQRAVQAWKLMTNGWTETEFERRLNQVKIQDKYPEIKEIVAKMGRVADANGKDRLTIASGVEMKMEHSAGSDIEGITVGDDLNSLLPLELAQYSDEDMEGLFIYKYRTRRLQTFRYKSEMSKPSRKLGFTHASRKGPMIVCLDTSASMYGTPERISSTLISLLEETAEDLERDCFLIDFSVSTRAIDLMAKRKAERLKRIGITMMESAEADASPSDGDGQAHTGRGIRRQPTTTHLPFIGGGTSAKKMMTQMFDLLDNDGLHYVNADVLWITDFLIPDPPQQLLSGFREYKETVPDSTASVSCVMTTRSRTAGRSTSIRFTPSGTARCEDIKEDVKAEKGYQMIIETCMKCIKNFIICYIWRKISVLRHFFELKIP